MDFPKRNSVAVSSVYRTSGQQYPSRTSEKGIGFQLLQTYHTEEERLNVNWGSIVGQIAYHMHNMVLHQPQIADLFSHEIWADQSPGVLPVRAIRVEDTMSQQLDRSLSAQLSDIEIRELRGQNTLHILRFVGKDQSFKENIRSEC